MSNSTDSGAGSIAAIAFPLKEDFLVQLQVGPITFFTISLTIPSVVANSLHAEDDVYSIYNTFQADT